MSEERLDYLISFYCEKDIVDKIHIKNFPLLRVHSPPVNQHIVVWN